TFHLMWLLETIEAQQFLIDDPHGCARTGSIFVIVVGIFRDSGKYHCAIRQSRRVGEAQWNSLDVPKIKRIDEQWCDRGRLLGAQRVKKFRKLKSYYGVLGMPLISALEQSQLSAADDSAFDIQRRKLFLERSKDRRTIDDLRRPAHGTLCVQSEQGAQP